MPLFSFLRVATHITDYYANKTRSLSPSLPACLPIQAPVSLSKMLAAAAAINAHYLVVMARYVPESRKRRRRQMSQSRSPSKLDRIKRVNLECQNLFFSSPFDRFACPLNSHKNVCLLAFCHHVRKSVLASQPDSF